MFTREERDQVEKALAEVNGRRRERLLSVAEVEALCREVQRGFDPTSESCWFHYVHGGDVPGSYGYPAVTTLCLAVALPGERLAVVIGLSNARSPTPGRAFGGGLQPWSDTQNERTEKRMLDWIQDHPDQVIWVNGEPIEEEVTK